VGEEGRVGVGGDGGGMRGGRVSGEGCGGVGGWVGGGCRGRVRLLSAVIYCYILIQPPTVSGRRL
jgi:hypothetical protein